MSLWIFVINSYWIHFIYVHIKFLCFFFSLANDTIISTTQTVYGVMAYPQKNVVMNTLSYALKLGHCQTLDNLVFFSLQFGEWPHYKHNADRLWCGCTTVWRRCGIWASRDYNGSGHYECAAAVSGRTGEFETIMKTWICKLVNLFLKASLFALMGTLKSNANHCM